MKTYYQASGWMKFSEEDIYQDGCQPNTGGHHGGNEVFKAESLGGLVETLLGFTGADYEGIDFDSCDEAGRIDIALMEDENGSKATRYQINEWKEGKIRLWDCIYSFYVEEIKAQPVQFNTNTTPAEA
jgi:hypothetical protein